MILGNRLTFSLPIEISDVPSDKVGVYSFSLSFPTDYQLGLIGKSIKLDKSISLLKIRLEKYKNALEHLTFNGTIESDVHGGHLRKKYLISAELEKTTLIDNLIDDFFSNEGVNEKSFKLLTQLLRESFLFSTPLYIGMTANQSFNTRLGQHISYQSNFSQLLKAQEITWAETKFECIPITGLSSNGINKIERIVQHLFKPSYCLG